MEKRVIKFRAWHTDSNRMIDWLDIQTWNFACISWECFQFMQFTGLLDKYGKEIYEGDILFHEIDEMNEVVIYNEKTAAFKREYEKGHALDFGVNTHKYVSVIGNIFESASLLKEKE